MSLDMEKKLLGDETAGVWFCFKMISATQEEVRELASRLDKAAMAYSRMEQELATIKNRLTAVSRKVQKKDKPLLD